MNISQALANELKITQKQVNNVIELLNEDNTIPFIARYRKEVTGGLDDEVLRNLHERLQFYLSLEAKRADVIRLISEQGNMNDELALMIEKAQSITELDDIYRPYRPKRRTRATIAKEKGLEPLALAILKQDSEGFSPRSSLYPTSK